jgi:hypothetical protein
MTGADPGNRTRRASPAANVQTLRCRFGGRSFDENRPSKLSRELPNISGDDGRFPLHDHVLILTMQGFAVSMSR